jgi:hypothetical protein
MGPGSIANEKHPLDLGDGSKGMPRRPCGRTDKPLRTVSCDGKQIRASISAGELPNTDIAVRGLMLPTVLPTAEGEELLRDPAALHELKEEFGDDAVKAAHAFLLSREDEHQESVLLMVLLSSSGSVNGVAGVRSAETESKATVVKLLHDRRISKFGPIMYNAPSSP